MGHNNIYTIPPGISFGRALASKLLQDYSDNPQDLAKVIILLPTRRACRTLQDICIDLSCGKPLLLPHIQPLGDVDEDLLAMHAQSDQFDFEPVPPAMGKFRRQILLAKFIEKREDLHGGYHRSLKLAAALGDFMDQILIEQRDLSDLVNIVPDEFASHWQITLDFLSIIAEFWPKILDEYGMIDEAERRNRLMANLSKFWSITKPDTHIIAAGTTGSVPATARLLSVIQNLPNGKIILPGLDQMMDQECWDSIEPSHPQNGLKGLIEFLDIKRTDVQTWPYAKQHNTERLKLASEMMRPAITSNHWPNIKTTQNINIETAISGIQIAHAKTPQEEADIIALACREALEIPDKKVAIITPDLTLARKVRAKLKRWGIDIDNSAGQSLTQSRLGNLVRLSLRVIQDRFSPVSTLALLKHPFCTMTTHKPDDIYDLDLALRGPKPPAGIDGLISKNKNHPPGLKILEKLKQAACRFIDLEDSAPFLSILDMHWDFLQTLTHSPDSDSIIWQSDEAEELTKIFAKMREESQVIGSIRFDDYAAIFENIMKDSVIRPRFGQHPRLTILGQLEARMVDSDMLILASLNEGIWPPNPSYDPWMSRTMRQDLGLSDPEKSVGLAAHDFIQSFCAREVLMTRSMLSDGAPTIPARWLQRLSTVLKLFDENVESALINIDYAKLIQELDRPENVQPCTRPEIKPRLEHRPRRLSVTQIETHIKDPYGIYAKKILGLERLDPLEKESDAAEKGTLLHAILEEFIQDHTDSLPSNAEEILMQIARYKINKNYDNADDYKYWLARFERIAHWFVHNEREWRTDVQTISTEEKGSAYIQDIDFTLSGIADRVDTLKSNHIALIDYKSGGSYSKKSMMNGHKPQLPLESLITKENGFHVKNKTASYLAYWKMTGGQNAGEVIALTNAKGDVDKALETTKAGLLNLIKTFDNPETPYIAIPRAQLKPDYNDYEHFTRIQEWSAQDDSEEAA